MVIKPIRTEADYEKTLHEVEDLMDAQPGTEEADRLDVLVTLVEAYEARHYPILPPDPIAVIEYYLDQRGLTRRALEPYLGSRARVSEILNRRRALTLPMIRRLQSGLGIPPDLLVQPYKLARPAKSTV